MADAGEGETMDFRSLGGLVELYCPNRLTKGDFRSPELPLWTLTVLFSVDVDFSLKMGGHLTATIQAPLLPILFAKPKACKFTCPTGL